MGGDDWRGFDVAAFNARTARSRERDADNAHREPAEQPCAAPARDDRADLSRSAVGAAPFSVLLPFPPTTNHDKSGAHFLKPETRAYRRAVAAIVASMAREPVPGRLAITLTLYPAPGRRAFDLDNRVKPALDALQHAGVFANDEAVDVLYVHRVYGVAADAAGERCLVMVTSLGPK